MRVLLALLVFCFASGTSWGQALQPGDSLSISVFQDPKLDRQVVVSPSGMIAFPLVGQIRVAGMTPARLEDLLKARLKDKYSSDLDISVAFVSGKPAEEDLKPRIFVTGEVLRPGFFVMRTRTNVMQAISLAGGFGPFAAQRRIQVRRKMNGEDAIFVFDYRQYFSGQNLSDNIELRAGDVVIVPEKGLFE
jgi:polysaccharide biosynthesis/export protein